MATDWTPIRTAYITSNKTVKQIANEYGMNESTTRHRAVKEEWGRQRRKFRATQESMELTKAQIMGTDVVSAKSPEEGLKKCREIAVQKLHLMMRDVDNPNDLRKLVQSLCDLRDADNTEALKAMGLSIQIPDEYKQ